MERIQENFLGAFKKFCHSFVAKIGLLSNTFRFFIFHVNFYWPRGIFFFGIESSSEEPHDDSSTDEEKIEFRKKLQRECEGIKKGCRIIL